MQKLTHLLFLAINLCIFLCISQALHAESEALPLEIDADTSDCGTDLENCTLSGNVVIRQGDAQITADKLFSRTENDWELNGNILIEKTGITITAQQANILLAARQLKSFALAGSPVNFRYLLGDESRASGKADSIAFDLETRKIILDGDAQILEAGNELNGEHIEYDIDAERLKANNQGKGDGRVHLIFEPPGKTEIETGTGSKDSPESDQTP